MMLSSLLAAFYLLVLLSVVQDSCAAVPANMFSPLIAQKVSSTAAAFAGNYPQYTTTNTGAWLFFSPDTWTSGFFPATLYEMNVRQKLCPSSGAGPNWLALGRSETAAIAHIETDDTVMHDVGFISFPFQAELVV